MYEEIRRCDVVLFEGILVFYHKEIRDLFNMKLFVDSDSDTRLSRRGNVLFRYQQPINSICLLDSDCIVMLRNRFFFVSFFSLFFFPFYSFLWNHQVVIRIGIIQNNVDAQHKRSWKIPVTVFTLLQTSLNFFFHNTWVFGIKQWLLLWQQFKIFENV